MRFYPKKVLSLNRRLSDAGLSLVEMVLVGALGAIFVGLSSLAVKQLVDHALRHRVQGQLALEALNGLDTMLQFLRNARSNTVVLSGTAQYPWSNLQFDNLNAGQITHYQFSLSPDDSVAYMTVRTPNNIQLQPKPMMHNVAYLIFSFPRGDDPTLMTIAFRLRASTGANRFATIDRSSFVRLLPPSLQPGS